MPLVVALGALSASAQNACPDELARAQSLYVQGEFADVEEILDPCLQPGRLSPDDQVRAYRLLALSALQTGRLVEAKLSVLSLLRLQPEYDADPALDPPVYADLVGTVRRQLAVEAPPQTVVDTARVTVRALPPPEPEPEPVGAPDPEVPDPESPNPEAEGVTDAASPVETAQRRRIHSIELNYWGGFIHYASDLSRSDVTDGYFLNDAARLGLQVGVTPARPVVLGLGVEAAYFSRFPKAGSVGGLRSLQPDAFVVQATLESRFRAGAESRVSPYVGLGLGAILVASQQESSVAAAPAASLGLDVWAASGLSLFLEATASMPFPIDAFDDPPNDTVDLFSGVRLGARSYFRR